MYLVLAHLDDATAISVYRELCLRQGRERVALITDEEISTGTGWTSTQDKNGIGTTLRLRDERTFTSEDITSVFNRFRYLNGQHFVTFDSRDREYAVGEMFALMMSWLSSLRCPVINPVGVRGFGFSNRTILEWFRLAGDVGIPTRAIHFTTDARLVSANGFAAFQPLPGMTLREIAQFQPVPSSVVGRAPTLLLEPVIEETQRLLVVGADSIGQPNEMESRCVTLAQRAGAGLLEFTFVRSSTKQDDVWRCGWINPSPQLLNESEISAVAGLLEAG